jgi:hypothetical protein
MHKYLLFALSGLMLSGCAAHTATSGRVAVKDDSAATVVRFSAGDRVAIEDFYRKSTPAKTSPGSMPLIRGGWLPADIGAEPLPPALERKLSPLPTSHARQKVGRNVVLIEKKTRVIADVLYNAAK